MPLSQSERMEDQTPKNLHAQAIIRAARRERKEKHYGFMCAAMMGSALIDKESWEVVLMARQDADAALTLWEKRWEGEEK